MTGPPGWGNAWRRGKLRFEPGNSAIRVGGIRIVDPLERIAIRFGSADKETVSRFGSHVGSEIQIGDHRPRISSSL